MNRISRRVLTLLLTGLLAGQTMASMPVLTAQAEEISAAQAVIGLPEGYVATGELPTPSKGEQRNGQDSGRTANGQLVKTAEWTDYDDGQGKVSLTYAVPEQNPSTAVFAMGTCMNHAFNDLVARNQILELLEQYDYVDVLTTKCDFKKYYWSGMDYLANDAEELILHLSAADGKDYNYNYIKSQITSCPDPTNYNTTGQDIFFGGSHVTGGMLLPYLTDYLKENHPTAIYVSFDGARAFGLIQNSVPQWQKSDEITLSRITYNATPEELKTMDYDELAYDRDTIETLAEYQAMGRYYVCISSVEVYQQAYYESELSKRHCYASFALADPYTLVHDEASLLEYLSGTKGTKNYKAFDRVGQPIIDYSQSFARNNTKFTTAPVTIQDTLAEGLTLQAEDIEVTITKDGTPITEMPEITKTIRGNSVTITIAKASVGQVVHVTLPFQIANANGRFYSESGSYADTNDGAAKVITSKGDEVTVDSPQLYKGGYRITTSVVNGTITDDILDIDDGATETIQYTPDDGYVLESVTVDGETVDIEQYPEQYTFENITGNHTIAVVYARINEPTTPGSGGGSDDDHHHSHHDSSSGSTTPVQTTLVDTVVPAVTIVEAGEVPVPGQEGAVSTGERDVATGDPATTGFLIALAGAAVVGLGIYLRKSRA